MDNEYKWRTSSVIQETADSVTIEFDTGNDDFVYRPGQFVNLTLQIDGQLVTRSYSFSSIPGIKEPPSITVRKKEGGLMSSYIVDHAAQINEWEVEGPYGFFYPDGEAVSAGRVVLVAGGSGITALYSLLKYYLDQSSAEILLVYANSSSARIIFQNRLSELEQRYPQRLTVWHVLSQPVTEDEANFKNLVKGRLSRLALKKILKNQLQDKTGEAYYFLCGPPGLLKLAEQTLDSLQVLPVHIYKEYFSPLPDGEPEITLPDTGQQVALQVNGRTERLIVDPGVTILEAAINRNLPVRFSCKSGNCGTCAAQMISGEVYMKRNFALREEQVNEGYILLCQSHPLDNKVYIKQDIAP